ncbi:hypothetical protein RchiOBHm_Chr6g0266671 [Rosa chinensis]|uniref:Aminotransferase-like plant mobile domain-containing protein n=1 Tax=Rosa chinensis TaxID=74649 RepID=A0A2P6PPT5_ROSCH|nr:uncharacterized protein LOC112170186 isoform X1 [Rosa chinensis]XP_024163147.1 uncharacterized protein LOC112170186 isoform X1 [Rosa chinensis]PRQ23916.1 hypothetical protein RchiOBHm_Chr6g0266671 [Rosa chinensis]
MKPNAKTNYAVANPSVVRVGRNNVEYEFGGVKPKILRCRPKLFKDVVSRFSDEKKVAVEEMGFGLLLQLQCEHLQLGLCGWLIDRFDPSKSSIEVHGKRFNLGPTDFENIMGVKDGGHDVEIRGSKADIQELKDIHFGNRYRICNMSEIAEKLKETNSVDDTFRVGFVLFALATFLCPSSSGDLTAKFLHPLRDINGIKFKNWATFSFSFLVESLSTFKKKNTTCIGGCVLFLKLFYFDLVVHGRTFVNRSLTPIVAWGEKEETKLVEWIGQNGGFNSLDIAIAYDRIAPIPISADEDEVVAVRNDHTVVATVEPQSQQKTNDITLVYKRRAAASFENSVVALRNDLAMLHKKVTKFKRALRQKTNDDKAAELEAKLGSEMSKIEGLTYWQVFQATNILATKYDLVTMFLPMSEQSKKAFVLNLLEHGTHGL